MSDCPRIELPAPYTFLRGFDPATIVVTPTGHTLVIVASVSSGKDSDALILALRELDVEAFYVAADTGWEAVIDGHDIFAEHLQMLRDRLGIQIDVVRATKQMREKIRDRAGFPGRLQRWCTRELKIEPLRAHHDRIENETGLETINAVGIRAEESEERAAMPMWVDDEEWGGYVWRPLLRWTVDDVIRIHRRHNIPMNPLYHLGFDRVGCFPCIHERKEGVRLVAEHAPERIDLIDDDETFCTEERVRRNEVEPGRYSHPRATFFQTAESRGYPVGIREVVAWAKTDRGGRQLPLLAPVPKGGCMRWGLCETPTDKDDES